MDLKMVIHSQTVPPVPRFATIKNSVAILGIGRSTLYKEAARGHIRLIKCGWRTLVDIPHALEWMATLPEASIAAPYKAGR